MIEVFAIRCAKVVDAVLIVAFILFSGCQPSSITSSSSRTVQSKSPSLEEADHDAAKDEKPARGNGKKGPVNNISSPQTGEKNAVPPEQVPPKIPQSKLNWDGKKLIGTDQLFLIPIE
jgi:hypothetical protein